MRPTVLEAAATDGRQLPGRHHACPCDGWAAGDDRRLRAHLCHVGGAEDDLGAMLAVGFHDAVLDPAAAPGANEAASAALLDARLSRPGSARVL